MGMRRIKIILVSLGSAYNSCIYPGGIQGLSRSARLALLLRRESDVHFRAAECPSIHPQLKGSFDRGCTHRDNKKDDVNEYTDV